MKPHHYFMLSTFFFCCGVCLTVYCVRKSEDRVRELENNIYLLIKRVSELRKEMGK